MGIVLKCFGLAMSSTSIIIGTVFGLDLGCLINVGV